MSFPRKRESRATDAAPALDPRLRGGDGWGVTNPRQTGWRRHQFAAVGLASQSVQATTKGLSQIVTPDLQPEGDLSLSFQAQDMQLVEPLPSGLLSAVHLIAR